MGVPLNDEIVVIQKGKYEGDLSLITVNCPDKLGLGCDLMRIFLDFGLDVVRADLSTDGKWCFGLFWVSHRDGTIKTIRWIALKKRLIAACPSTRPHILLPQLSEPKLNATHVLQTSSRDRPDLLNEKNALVDAVNEIFAYPSKALWMDSSLAGWINLNVHTFVPGLSLKDRGISLCYLRKLFI